tara:strand:+ start:250 stop:831 length:582 start_codon:yes stop_codon:yes gene_type:complete
MDGLLKEINKVRQKLKDGPSSSLLLQKPFAEGMYRFSMFMMNYYSRVRKNLKLDYDSFMIVQTVVSHSLYQLHKKQPASYKDLTMFWELMIKNLDGPLELISNQSNTNNLKQKLTISSICLVLGLPKETVRRKINQLSNKNLLKNSNKLGISLGPMYKKVFQDFVPETTLETSKLVKGWEKSGVLKGLLSFKS